MKIKICGITCADDAILAERLGAWGVGFIFHPASPRYVSLETAAEIIARLGAIEKVGVFVGANPELVARARAIGITVAQLHGGETAADARRIGGRLIRAARLASQEELAALEGYPAETFLVDGPRAGERANWRLAREAKRFGEVFLAGGISAANVKEAVGEVAPHGLDLSSSLESAPGIKDPQKLREFFEEVNGL